MDIDGQDSRPLDLITMHVDKLLNALQNRLFTSTGSTATKVKGKIRLIPTDNTKRQLHILVEVSHMASTVTTAQANQMLQLLVPLFKQKNMSDEIRAMLFAVFAHVVPFSSNPSSQVPVLGQLFGFLNSRDTRVGLCKALRLLLFSFAMS